jgi:hypothetical protein
MIDFLIAISPVIPLAVVVVHVARRKRRQSR